MSGLEIFAIATLAQALPAMFQVCGEAPSPYAPPSEWVTWIDGWSKNLDLSDFGISSEGLNNLKQEAKEFLSSCKSEKLSESKEDLGELKTKVLSAFKAIAESSDGKDLKQKLDETLKQGNKQKLPDVPGQVGQKQAEK